FDGDQDGSIQGEEQGVLGPNDMVAFDGNPSDGGLSLKITGNGTYTVPIGIDTTGTELLHNGAKYTPAEVTVSNFNDDGYITINPVYAVLQTTDLTGGDILSYYWRVDYSDFTTEPTVEYSFNYYEADLDGSANEGSFVPGKVQDINPYNRSYENDNSQVNDVPDTDDTLNVIVFNDHNNGGNGFTLEKANYTAGAANRFVGAPEVYYSRDDGDWNNSSIWSTVSHTSATNTGTYPQEGDIAIVGYGGPLDANSNDAGVNFNFHRLDIVGSINVAELNFNSHVDADARTLSLSRVKLFPGETINAAIVSGFGELDLRYDSDNRGNDPVLNIDDVGDFASNPESNVYLIYMDGTDGDELLLDLDNDIGPFKSEFPSLRFTASPVNSSADKDNTIAFTSSSTPYDITVNGDLIVDQRTAFILDGNIDVVGTTYIGARRDGELIFTNGASPVTLTTHDIIFGSDIYGSDRSENRNKIFVQPGGGNDIEHTLEVSGSIYWATGSEGTYPDAGSEFDLTGDITSDNDVVLRLTESGLDSLNIDYDSETGITNGILSTLELYRVELNKGADTTSTFIFEDNFTLTGPTSGVGVDKALELQNGKLILNDPNINVDLTTGDDDFFIPGTAGLEVRKGQASASGNSGILLDGKLQISGGSVDMSGGDNYIQYSASGNATIEVSDGTFTVGSQIRRSLTTEEGILNYTQSGGTVIVGNDAAPENNRGVFEILNSGSAFSHTGGDLIIARAQENPSLASFYFDPETANFGEGTTIQFGNGSTPPNDEMGIYSTTPIPNILIDGTQTPVLKQWVVPLTVSDDLQILSGATYDANGLNLTLEGDMTVNGSYEPNGNTTYFRGSEAQQIVGSPAFWN
ncbi:hypothetical protein, partial [Marinilabilia sp.]